MRRRSICAASAAVLAALCSTVALAQDAFPSKPIRMLVPFPPGGVVDILARLIAPRMGDGLKQSLIVDNRPGANGNIASEAVAKSQPDGYTLLFAQVSNLAVNPAIYKTVPFDPVKDLAPVGLVAATPQIMVVSAGSKMQSIGDVIAAVKARPGEVTFASSGNGSMTHMGLELMQISAGLKFLHVPYKGAAPAVIDVIGGRADLFMAAAPSVTGQIRGGKLKAIAVTSATRMKEMPDIPTLAESGFPGFETTNWFAVMGRAGTPQPIIARLNAELNAALQNGEVKAKIASESGEVLGGSPERLARQLATDLAKWKRVVKEAGLKLE
jgi:tripartite-type tricarboxylate transporter receptor subunit TctC